MSDASRLEAIYARLPDVPCKGLCFDSCSYIGMSEAEFRRIKRERGVEIEMHCSPCPALDFAGRCSIYELRPLVCRVYGVTERLRCPHGCKPERWLSDSECQEIFAEATAIAGGHNDEEVALVGTALQMMRGE